MAPALAALGAKLKVIGANGEREIGNTLTGSGNWGSIGVQLSHNNTFYGNYFIDNYIHVLIQEDVSSNNWDNGYPTGGNYWDNYEDRYSNAKDEKRGPYQNQTGPDGFWDTPYRINDKNKDHYPIVPELPSLILPLFMLAASLVALICKKKSNI